MTQKSSHNAQHLSFTCMQRQLQEEAEQTRKGEEGGESGEGERRRLHYNPLTLRFTDPETRRAFRAEQMMAVAWSPRPFTRRNEEGRKRSPSSTSSQRRQGGYSNDNNRNSSSSTGGSSSGGSLSPLAFSSFASLLFCLAEGLHHALKLTLVLTIAAANKGYFTAYDDNVEFKPPSAAISSTSYGGSGANSTTISSSSSSSSSAGSSNAIVWLHGGTLFPPPPLLPLLVSPPPRHLSSLPLPNASSSTSNADLAANFYCREEASFLRRQRQFQGEEEEYEGISNYNGSLYNGSHWTDPFENRTSRYRSDVSTRRAAAAMQQSVLAGCLGLFVALFSIAAAAEAATLVRFLQCGGSGASSAHYFREAATAGDPTKAHNRRDHSRRRRCNRAPGAESPPPPLPTATMTTADPTITLTAAAAIMPETLQPHHQHRLNNNDSRHNDSHVPSYATTTGNSTSTNSRNNIINNPHIPEYSKGQPGQSGGGGEGTTAATNAVVAVAASEPPQQRLSKNISPTRDSTCLMPPVNSPFVCDDDDDDPADAAKRATTLSSRSSLSSSQCFTGAARVLPPSSTSSCCDSSSSSSSSSCCSSSSSCGSGNGMDGVGGVQRRALKSIQTHEGGGGREPSRRRRHECRLVLHQREGEQPPLTPTQNHSRAKRQQTNLQEQQKGATTALVRWWVLAEAAAVLFLAAEVGSYLLDAAFEDPLGCIPHDAYYEAVPPLTSSLHNYPTTTIINSETSINNITTNNTLATIPHNRNSSSVLESPFLADVTASLAQASAARSSSSSLSPSLALLAFVAGPTAARVFQCAVGVRYQLPNIFLFVVICRKPGIPALILTAAAVVIVATLRVSGLVPLRDVGSTQTSSNIFFLNDTTATTNSSSTRLLGPLWALLPSPYALPLLPPALVYGYVMMSVIIAAALTALRWFLDRSSRVSFVARQRAAARVEQLRFESKALRAFAGELVPRRGGGGGPDGGASTVAALWLSASTGGATQIFSQASPRAGPPSPVTPATAGAPAIQRGRHPGSSRRVLRQAAQALRSAVFVRELVEGRDYGPRAAVLCVGLLQYAAFSHHLRPHDAAVATVAVFSRLHEVLCPAAFGHPPSADEPDATERLGDAYVAVFGLGDNGDGPQGPQAALLKASRCLGAGLSLAGQWAQQRNEAGALILPPLCFSLHCGPAVGEFPGLSPSTARYSLGGSGVEAGLALLQACAPPDHVTLVSAAAINALGPAAVVDPGEPPTTAAIPCGQTHSRDPLKTRHKNEPHEDNTTTSSGITWGEPASTTETTIPTTPAVIEGFARVSVNLFFEPPCAPLPQPPHPTCVGDAADTTTTSTTTNNRQPPAESHPSEAGQRAHSPDVDDHHHIPQQNFFRNREEMMEEEGDDVGARRAAEEEEDATQQQQPPMRPLQHHDGERGPFFTQSSAGFVCPTVEPAVEIEGGGKREEDDDDKDEDVRQLREEVTGNRIAGKLQDSESDSRTQTPPAATTTMTSSAAQSLSQQGRSLLSSVIAAGSSSIGGGGGLSCEPSSSCFTQQQQQQQQEQLTSGGDAGKKNQQKEDHNNGKKKKRRIARRVKMDKRSDDENETNPCERDEENEGGSNGSEEEAAHSVNQHPDLGFLHEPFLDSVSRVAAIRDTSAADAVVAGITATRRLLAEVAAEQRTRLALVAGPPAASTAPANSRNRSHCSSLFCCAAGKSSDHGKNTSGCAALVASVVNALQPLAFADPATEHEYTQRHLRYDILYIPRLVTCIVGALSNIFSVLNLALEADGWATLLRRADIEPNDIPEDINPWSNRHLFGVGFGLLLILLNVDAGLYFFWTRRNHNRSRSRSDDSSRAHTTTIAPGGRTPQEGEGERASASNVYKHNGASAWFGGAVAFLGRCRRQVLHTFAFRATAAFSLLHLLAPSSFAINGGLAAYALVVGPLLIDPMPTVCVLPLLIATFGVPAVVLVVTAALHPLILLTPATVIYLSIGVFTAVAARLELDRGQRTAFAAGRLAAAAAEALDKQVRMRDAVVARVAAPSQRRLMALMAVRAATPPGPPDGPPLPPVDDAGAFGAAATAASALAPDRRVLRLVAGGQPVAVVDLEGVVVVRVRVEPGPVMFDRPASAEEVAVNEVGRFCAAALLVARVDALLLRFPLLGVVEARGCEVVLGGPWGNGAGGDGSGPRGSATAAHAVAALQFLAELRRAVAEDGGGARVTAVATVDDVVVLMRNPLYPVFDVCGPGALRTRELLRAAPLGSVVCTDGLRRVASLALPTAAADRLLPPSGPWAVRGLPVTRMYAVAFED